MGITINISGGGSATAPSSATDPAAGLMSHDAGSSVALDPEGADLTANALPRERAIDGGSPSAALVQEIEAALLDAGATTHDITSSTDGVNAGAAPV